MHPIAVVVYKSIRQLMPHLEPSATRRKAKRTETKLPRFHVFDGASRVVIEAQSEEDAFYLCIEMGWELICACEG